LIQPTSYRPLQQTAKNFASRETETDPPRTCTFYAIAVPNKERGTENTANLLSEVFLHARWKESFDRSNHQNGDSYFTLLRIYAGV